MKTIEQFVTISYGRPFLPVPGMEACFFDAGTFSVPAPFISR
jgi:hypothetical protein